MEDFNFTAKVTDINLSGLSKHLNAGAGIDVGAAKSEFTVKFHLDFDAKEWGIKSIGVIVDSIAGELAWECNDEELTEAEVATLISAGGKRYSNGDIEGGITIDSKQGWTINDDDLKFQDDGQLMVTEIDIDLIAKTLKVY